MFHLYSCLIEKINGLSDKGQFQCLTGLKGSQEGTYLYMTCFFFTKININNL